MKNCFVKIIRITIVRNDAPHLCCCYPKTMIVFSTFLLHSKQRVFFLYNFLIRGLPGLKTFLILIEVSIEIDAELFECFAGASLGWSFVSFRLWDLGSTTLSGGVVFSFTRSSCCRITLLICPTCRAFMLNTFSSSGLHRMMAGLFLSNNSFDFIISLMSSNISTRVQSFLFAFSFVAKYGVPTFCAM